MERNRASKILEQADSEGHPTVFPQSPKGRRSVATKPGEEGGKFRHCPLQLLWEKFGRRSELNAGPRRIFTMSFLRWEGEEPFNSQRGMKTNAGSTKGAKSLCCRKELLEIKVIDGCMAIRGQQMEKKPIRDMDPELGRYLPLRKVRTPGGPRETRLT